LQWIFEDKPLIVPLGICLLFVLHPLHTEVVANIKGRDELLAFLGLCASLFYLCKYLQSENKKILALSLLFLTIALFSKESAVTYAFIIPLLLLLNHKIEFKKAIKIGALMGIFSLGFFALRANIIGSMEREVDAGNFGLLNNPIAVAESAKLKWGSIFDLQFTFLKKLILPIDLLHDYSYNQIPLVEIASPTSIFGLLILAALIGLSIYGLMRKNLWGYIAIIYLCTIVVASQIFLSIGIQFAERMLFLSVLPFVIGITLLLSKLLENKSNKLLLKEQKKLMWIFIGIGLAYGFQTMDRNNDWENNLSLYEADIQKGAASARVNYNLGSVLNEQAMKMNLENQKMQTFNRAIGYLNQAISIYPDYEDAYNNLGLAYKNSGNTQKAIEVYLANIKQNPNYSKNYFNLGTTYFKDKQFVKAILSLQEYANRVPNNASVYFLMGQAAGNLQDFNRAIQYLNQSLAIEANNIDALNYLGMAYAMTAKNQNAQEVFHRALQIDSRRTDILMNLALSYHQENKIDQEINTLQKVININPNHQTAKAQIEALKSAKAQ